MICKC